MDWREYIEQKPGVMLGKPVLKGTRITVEFILDRLAQGWPPNELAASFPEIGTEQIHAVLAYAASVIRMDETIYKAS